ncbi:hypothetical protein [Nocardia sp. NPDC048505]|uniref:hypothetical protein n=1 Tax=unclassified Nocardia TaxID=2637762 RepID=UPI0033DA50DA
MAEPFVMRVTEVFHVPGRGVIVVGTMRSGVAAVGDELEIIAPTGARRRTTLVGIDLIGREPMDSAVASLVLRPLRPDQIQPGYSVVTPGVAE